MSLYSDGPGSSPSWLMSFVPQQPAHGRSDARVGGGRGYPDLGPGLKGLVGPWTRGVLEPGVKEKSRVSSPVEQSPVESV